MLKLIVERGKSRSPAEIAIARFVSQKCAALVSTCAETAATLYSSGQAETKLDGAGWQLETDGFVRILGNPPFLPAQPLLILTPTPATSASIAGSEEVDQAPLPTHLCAMAGGIGQRP